MLSKRIGPYYHPTNAHEHKYWVWKMLEKDHHWLVVKADPYNPSEYQVNLKSTRIGEFCQCPHHTNRKVPCLHMGFAKEAKEQWEFWQGCGMNP